MTWIAYRIVFRLLSPLHVGYLKVGNLMRTRHYVPGKTLWGALTARLTRDFPSLIDDPSKPYEDVEAKVNTQLAFSYFYPALDPDEPLWPDLTNEDLEYGPCAMPPDEFTWRLLASYASTASDAGRAAAEDGSLHEVEFINAYDKETGEPVYLVGYIFERQGCELPWREVLGRLQLGGERRYGWGRVCLERQSQADTSLFGYAFERDKDRPRVHSERDQPILAHAQAVGIQARGQIEPFLGRETRTDGRFGGSGLRSVQICWVPGSQVAQDCSFSLGEFGIWDPI